MANLFNDDARCVALWKMESGALTTDSKGTNTLTDANTVTEDAADFKEGACAAVFTAANTEHLYIDDASLDAGFPFKNGDAVKKGSFCFWYKPTTHSAYQMILGKSHYYPTAIASFHIMNNNGALTIEYGQGGSTWNDTDTGITLTDGHWYHIGVTVNVSGAVNVRVWDATDSILYTYTNTFSGAIGIDSNAFVIGDRSGYQAGNALNARIDEVVVFNDVITNAEIDEIRAGTFGGYVGQVPLIFTPQAETYGPHAYVGQIPLMLTPQAVSGGPHTPYVGALLLRMTPMADYEPVGAGTSTVISASTGGWAMGGTGVWGGSTPATTNMSLLADAEPTGFYLGGGAEAISTIPAAETIAAEVAFQFCGPGATGNTSTSEPAQDVIEDVVGFVMGGAGVWGQVAPGDIPSAALVGSGGFILSGSGFSLDPAVTPTATVIISTGGFILGGPRSDPAEVAYPESYDRVIDETVAFEMGGEGAWGGSLPPATVIVSKGAIFVLGGDGVAVTQSPPLVVITGDGGFAIGGTGWPTDSGSDTYVLTGETFGASLYSNFDFAAYAQFRGKYYGVGADGVYLLEGSDDAGDAIHSGVRLPSSNFGTANYKRLRAVNIGNQSNGARVRVKADDREGVAEVIRGKAMIARNLQAREMIVDIMDFDTLSHLELVPLIIAWD